MKIYAYLQKKGLERIGKQTFHRQLQRSRNKIKLNSNETKIEKKLVRKILDRFCMLFKSQILLKHK